MPPRIQPKAKPEAMRSMQAPHWWERRPAAALSVTVIKPERFPLSDRELLRRYLDGCDGHGKSSALASTLAGWKLHRIGGMAATW